MPGIYGVANSKNIKLDLERMAAAMFLYDHFIQDEFFFDRHVGASRVHIGKVGEKASPARDDKLALWIEGEAYNVADVARELSLRVGSLSELLLSAEKTSQLDNCLNRLDGYFCAALFDIESKRVKVFSDRYGMRLLYWYHKNGIFAWGSEVKSILAIDGADQELDSTSYDCFMDLGYLMGEHTWFKHIKLIKPATVIEYDLKSDTLSQYHYWKWSEIKPSNLTLDEAVDELGSRFIEAVRRRFDPNERIGVSLSGGLDSRAILAVIDHLYPEFKGYAYTFGIPGCNDISIAEQVISRAYNWQHKKFYFSAYNWFEPRVEKIWNTDGMQDMMHMHGSEFLPEIAKKIDINLNGFLGDAVLGGSYFKDTSYLNKRINTALAEKLYGVHAEGFSDEFYATAHYDNFLYMMRGRRFINYGTVNALAWVDQRKPFFDNMLVELIFSLPDEYRLNNQIYALMLQKFFPKYFTDIPWQQTGKPVAPLKDNSLPFQIINKVVRGTRKFIGVKSNRGYTDYAGWTREPELANKLAIILDASSAQYRRLTNDDLKHKFLTTHVNNRYKDNSNKVLRAVTIEIYLRKVFG